MARITHNEAAVLPERRDAKKKSKLHDKQSERDYRELRIDKVGVRGMRFPILGIRHKAK